MTAPSFMDLALKTAENAGKAGEVPIGCVIVRGYEVIATVFALVLFVQMIDGGSLAQAGNPIAYSEFVRQVTAEDAVVPIAKVGRERVLNDPCEGQILWDRALDGFHARRNNKDQIE